MTGQLELLSPAGDTDLGIAAINHGADAVYIGAPKFSARAAAGVSVADIARLIKHAHLYFAKVYVALNTILTDAELAESLEIIQTLYELGADGLILQDVGLLELDLPPIALIASTQMHNSTPEKVKFLEDTGFQRVILARELSLAEIADIRRKASKIELEAFVHGALCVSYSGQCYMSQAVAGRSGNRGVCAQPCRSHYTLIDRSGNKILQDKYLLSLKDMNRINAIPDLISAGVTSFKIEGRYKEIEYVINVTSAYRQAIDRFISGHSTYRRASSGESSIAFSPDLDRTFNRGYTPYFLSGRQDKVASIATPKATGQYLGKITALGKDYFRMARHDLQNGDGLCFFTSENYLAGFRVERVDKVKIFPGSMKGLGVGTELYRNHDKGFVRMLKKSPGNRRIAVEMHFMQDNHVNRLLAKDEDGCTAEVLKEMAFQPSRNPETAKAQIEKQINSTGNTPYRITKTTIEPQNPGFLPVSLLNGIRREVLEKLTSVRQSVYTRQAIHFLPNEVPYPEKNLDFHANVLNRSAREFYERHGATVVEPAFESGSEGKPCSLPQSSPADNVKTPCSGLTASPAFALQRPADPVGKTVMTSRYCIRYQLNLCPKLQSPAHPVKEPLKLKDAHHTYRLEFDCKHCRMFVIFEA